MSLRFTPGTPNFTRYRKYIDNAFGYTRGMSLPDQDGVYALDQNFRWTSWQARKRLRVGGNRARLAVSTNRPMAKERTNHVFIVTPWEKVKVPLVAEAWRSIEIAMPHHLRLNTIDVEIVTFDHWFPVEECGIPDNRCLGVMILEDEQLLNALPPWRGFAALTPAETQRLTEFRFQEAKPLADW